MCSAVPVRVSTELALTGIVVLSLIVIKSGPVYEISERVIVYAFALAPVPVKSSSRASVVSLIVAVTTPVVRAEIILA